MEGRHYRWLVILNTIGILLIAFAMFEGSNQDDQLLQAVSQENEQLETQNKKLAARLADLSDDMAELQFELTKLPQINQYPTAHTVERYYVTPAEDEAPRDFTETDAVSVESDVWSGVDEVVPHAYQIEGYDSLDSRIDHEALMKRDCYGRGEGVIGMFAAIAARCPDWYLGDGIIIID